MRSPLFDFDVNLWGGGGLLQTRRAGIDTTRVSRRSRHLVYCRIWTRIRTWITGWVTETGEKLIAKLLPVSSRPQQRDSRQNQNVEAEGKKDINALGVLDSSNTDTLASHSSARPLVRSAYRHRREKKRKQTRGSHRPSPIARSPTQTPASAREQKTQKEKRNVDRTCRVPHLASVACLS